MAILNLAQFQFQTQPDPKIPGNTLVSVSPGARALFHGGVVVDISIGLDKHSAEARRKARELVPAPKIVKALVDTGCNVTSVDHSVLSTLGLKTRGMVQTGTANGATTATQHSVEIGFPGTQLRSYPLLFVSSVNLSGQPIQALIGRDILAQWVMVYNGPFASVSISD